MLKYENGNYIEIEADELLEEVIPEPPRSLEERVDELKEDLEGFEKLVEPLLKFAEVKE